MRAWPSANKRAETISVAHSLASILSLLLAYKCDSKMVSSARLGFANTPKRSLCCSALHSSRRRAEPLKPQRSASSRTGSISCGCSQSLAKPKTHSTHSNALGHTVIAFDATQSEIQSDHLRLPSNCVRLLRTPCRCLIALLPKDYSFKTQLSKSPNWNMQIV